MMSELLGFFLERRRRRGALKTWPAEPGYPDSAIDVVEIDQAIRGLRAPGKRQIGAVACGIAGPNASDLTTLQVEIAAKFARNIKHPPSSGIIADKQHVIVGPEIMNAAFGDFVNRYFSRMPDVGDVYHVANSADGDALFAVNVELRRKNLVADKKIVVVTECGVRSGEPTVAVELVMIKFVLRHKLRMLRAAAFHSISYVEDNKAITPVSKVCKAILHVQIVKIASVRHRSHGTGNHRSRWVLNLPARHFLGILRILKIDYAQRACRIVGNVHVVRVDERAVHPTRHGLGIFRKDFQMCGV